MKWMIASDIHGSAWWCGRLAEAFAEENCRRLLLLGDLLYHGPRNDLPRDYAPREVIRQLTALQQFILCVRGNCDTEVDQMVLPFPIMAEYALLQAGDHLVFATHGHHFHAKNIPPLQTGDVLLHGHTHVPCCEKVNGVWVMNPGSVSIPKEDSWHGYMLLEGDTFTWKDFDGKVRLMQRLSE